MPRPTVILWMLTALAVWGLPGCTATIGGDGRSLSQHNDELRQTNAALREQLDETQKQIGLLEGELSSHRQTAAAGAALPAGAAIPGEIPGGVPVLSGLVFARYTGPVDTDGDSADDAVRLYLRPVDQHGRILVVAGSVNVQVVELRADAVPRVVVDRTFGAEEFAAAYRTGLTGDHFTLEVPMSPDDLGEADQVTVRATLTQADTGARVSEQAAFAVGR